MKRTEVTYGQLDKVLRSLGFTCRLVEGEPPARVYDHKESGASIMLPPFPEKDRVLEYHLVTARVMLDHYGIADPITFDAKLAYETDHWSVALIGKNLADRRYFEPFPSGLGLIAPGEPLTVYVVATAKR